MKNVKASLKSISKGGFSMSASYTLLTNILVNRHFHNAFQPICQTANWKVYAYESLFRTNEPVNIEAIFQEARRHNRLFDLDILSIKNAVAHFKPYFEQGIQLFVNIFPSTILHHLFPKFTKKLAADFPYIRNGLVFEISESKDEELIWDVPFICERIQLIKEYGCFIALDDVGKGATSLQKVIEIQPDYLKLDQYFSLDLYKSKEKQEIVSLFAQFCLNKKGLILEGIEKPEDLAIAKLLNVPLLQGYLLGRPERINERLQLKKIIDL